MFYFPFSHDFLRTTLISAHSSFYYPNLREKLYNCNIVWAGSNTCRHRGAQGIYIGGKSSGGEKKGDLDQSLMIYGRKNVFQTASRNKTCFVKSSAHQCTLFHIHTSDILHILIDAQLQLLLSKGLQPTKMISRILHRTFHYL